MIRLFRLAFNNKFIHITNASRFKKKIIKLALNGMNSVEHPTAI